VSPSPTASFLEVEMRGDIAFEGVIELRAEVPKQYYTTLVDG
jgi:hypothetical protein